MLLIGVPVSHTMLRTAVAGLRGGSVRMSAAATQTRSALLEQTGLPKFDEIEIRGEDFSGNEYPEAPAFTFSAGALYRSEQGWFLGANVRHVAGYFSFGDIANQPTREVEAYTVVDARMGWEWQNHTVTLFAKNLFDEDYLTSVNTVDGGAIAPDYGFIGDGRQLGLTLNTRF